MKVGSHIECAIDTLSKDGSKELWHEDANRDFRQEERDGGCHAHEHERWRHVSKREAASIPGHDVLPGATRKRKPPARGVRVRPQGDYLSDECCIDATLRGLGKAARQS